MMTLTYIKAGKFKHAEKYGQQTLTLAQSDESDRFKIRYQTLKSELAWQNGDIDEAYSTLEQAVKPVISERG